jgi:hypothetical protein
MYKRNYAEIMNEQKEAEESQKRFKSHPQAHNNIFLVKKRPADVLQVQAQQPKKQKTLPSMFNTFRFRKQDVYSHEQVLNILNDAMHHMKQDAVENEQRQHESLMQDVYEDMPNQTSENTSYNCLFFIHRYFYGLQIFRRRYVAYT